MAVARLRKVGGSTMVAIPPALLEEAHLSPEGSVDLSVEDGRIVMMPARKKYTLAELLDQCDPAASLSQDEREWLDAPSAGMERDHWPEEPA
ncbi:AbrB/MazE/SpoVT family DNA-binding domain-containing protein [Microvirga sp. 2TAF3]|uniref:AbrB/MazE/SpoVT family DNA-binding domain-containing protein n=1 Tax=Microvirga sp. 2TAF3 TaxID=3233014 RepID=UPI003F95B784